MEKHPAEPTLLLRKRIEKIIKAIEKERGQD